MRSIKVALATAVVVGATISGAYAAGVVNKNGHEVDAHASHGQSVAAAAPAKHLDAEADASTTDPATSPAEASGTDEASEAPEASEATEPTTPAEPSAPATADEGKHLGQVTPHTHVGHAWGTGHGKGQPVKPAKPTKDEKAAARDAKKAAHKAEQAAKHPAKPSKPAKPSTTD